jgi:serine phosphatase RsbU (regulator of sigma subunit)
LPAILVHADGTVERLAEGGSVLGYFDDWDYSQQTVPLPAGSRLLLFTDGVVDACDSNWQEFGEERLIEAAVEHRHLGAEVIKQSILSSVLAHCDGKLQDDATLVVVEVI